MKVKGDPTLRELRELRDECDELARRMTQEEIERGAELSRQLLVLTKEIDGIYEAVRARTSGL